MRFASTLLVSAFFALMVVISSPANAQVGETPRCTDLYGPAPNYASYFMNIDDDSTYYHEWDTSSLLIPLPFNQGGLVGLVKFDGEINSLGHYNSAFNTCYSDGLQKGVRLTQVHFYDIRGREICHDDPYVFPINGYPFNYTHNMFVVDVTTPPSGEVQLCQATATGESELLCQPWDDYANSPPYFGIPCPDRLYYFNWNSTYRSFYYTEIDQCYAVDNPAPPLAPFSPGTLAVTTPPVPEPPRFFRRPV